jgi:two-component system response regulator YesN
MQPKLKALLVDDETKIIQNLQIVISWQKLGIDVVGHAGNGLQALSAVKAYDPDIILCDIRMPVMDGIAFLRELRAYGSKAKVIMLTGYQEFEYARSVIKYQVREYFLKPIDYDELESLLSDIAREVRLSGANTDPLFSPETDGKRTSQMLMTSAKDYIERKLSSDLGIDEIADYVNISPSYFTILFKQCYGKTFLEYVTSRRLEIAKSFLLNSDRSITQIGKMVGYMDRRYFTKVFQKHTGMIPSEFRERERGLQR